MADLEQFARQVAEDKQQREIALADSICRDNADQKLRLAVGAVCSPFGGWQEPELTEKLQCVFESMNEAAAALFTAADVEGVDESKILSDWGQSFRDVPPDAMAIVCHHAKELLLQACAGQLTPDALRETYAVPDARHTFSFIYFFAQRLLGPKGIGEPPQTEIPAEESAQNGTKPKEKKSRKQRRNRVPRAVSFLQSYLENQENCGKSQKEMAVELGLTESEVSKAFHHEKFGPGLKDLVARAMIRPESIDVMDMPRLAGRKF